MIPDSRHPSFLPFHLQSPHPLPPPRSLSLRRRGCRSRLALHGLAFGARLRHISGGSPVDGIESSSMGLTYGLAVRLGLLSTPSLDDAVTSGYGQPVLCPKRTFTSLLGCALRRTETRLQCWSRWCAGVLGRCPQAGMSDAFSVAEKNEARVPPSGARQHVCWHGDITQVTLPDITWVTLHFLRDRAPWYRLHAPALRFPSFSLNRPPAGSRCHALCLSITRDLRHAEGASHTSLRATPQEHRPPSLPSALKARFMLRNLQSQTYRSSNATPCFRRKLRYSS